MNVVEPRFHLIHHTPSATGLLQQLNTTRVWNRQRPASVTMVAAEAAAAAAVAGDAIVVVQLSEISDAPVGEVHCTATFEL